MSTVWDMLSSRFVWDDVQGFVKIHLMKYGHSKQDIDQINVPENLKSIAYDDAGAEYILNELWGSHPSLIPMLSPPLIQHQQSAAGTTPAESRTKAG